MLTSRPDIQSEGEAPLPSCSSLPTVMGVKSYSVKVVVVVLYFETLQVCFPTSHTLHYTLQVSAGGKRLFYVYRTDFVQSYCNFGLLTIDIAYRKYLFKSLLINETILRMFRRLRTLSW